MTNRAWMESEALWGLPGGGDIGAGAWGMHGGCIVPRTSRQREPHEHSLEVRKGLHQPRSSTSHAWGGGWKVGGPLQDGHGPRVPLPGPPLPQTGPSSGGPATPYPARFHSLSRLLAWWSVHPFPRFLKPPSQVRLWTPWQGVHMARGGSPPLGSAFSAGESHSPG